MKYPVRIPGFCRSLILLSIVLAGYQCAIAQTGSLPPRPDSIRADKGAPGDDSPMTTMEEELRKKREIKFAEKEHRENVARADEITELGKGLTTSFKQKNSLDREDVKRLERLEKLTRKIRNEAGGEDGEVTLENPPTDLNSGVCRIGEVAASVGEKVKQTPRQVISAAVIDEANVLLELIRRVRGMAR
ncbi:MAG TPA: hypothetical protein VE135_22775 [Pyrinomonadaceae bacterium]|nr:hypothetical protein [Pyrinomonadaceae bacterium]